jgi:hypothetical protein
MALIVEDGSGLTTADSPNSLAEITAYCTARPRMVGWAGLGETQQEAAARDASRLLEHEYRDRHTGVPRLAGQALSYPRSGAWDARGRSLTSTTVPQAWKDAHAELSHRVAFVEQAPFSCVSEVVEVILSGLVQPVGKVLVTQGWAGGGGWL